MEGGSSTFPPPGGGRGGRGGGVGGVGGGREAYKPETPRVYGLMRESVAPAPKPAMTLALRAVK